MAEKNRHLELFSKIKWGDKFNGLGGGLKNLGKSFYYGFKYYPCPFYDLLFVSTLIGTCILFHLDRLLFEKTHLAFFYPKSAFLYWGYRLFWLSAPYLAWGLKKAWNSGSMRKDLAIRLFKSNLQNRLNELPDFVSDRPIDSSTRILKLTKSGLPLKTFTENKDRLESSLLVTVDQIIDNKERGTVDIIYGYGEMPKYSRLWTEFEMSLLTVLSLVKQGLAKSWLL